MQGVENLIHRCFRLEFTITLGTLYQTMGCIIVLERYVRIKSGAVG
jgi:hypothetical protein